MAERDECLYVGDAQTPEELLAQNSPKQREEREESLLALIQEHIDLARDKADASDDPEEKAYHEGRANGYGEAASLLRAHSPEEPVGITEWREPVYVYMPSHWRETIREHPDALIGFHYQLRDHDAEVEEWERVAVYSIGQPLDGGERSDG